MQETTDVTGEIRGRMTTTTWSHRRRLKRIHVFTNPLNARRAIDHLQHLIELLMIPTGKDLLLGLAI
jgi:hypothetical protein